MSKSYAVSRNGERGGRMNGKRPYMDYCQHRAACRLVHECCNYDNGNCIVLDNGEPCVCVQSISYSLLCRLLFCKLNDALFATLNDAVHA